MPTASPLRPPRPALSTAPVAAAVSAVERQLDSAACFYRRPPSSVPAAVISHLVPSSRATLTTSSLPICRPAALLLHLAPRNSARDPVTCSLPGTRNSFNRHSPPPTTRPPKPGCIFPLGV
ncbi:hypothetical protein IAR50_006991 [Cryptococcus sp. DSM 104548]